MLFYIHLVNFKIQSIIRDRYNITKSYLSDTYERVITSTSLNASYRSIGVIFVNW